MYANQRSIEYLAEHLICHAVYTYGIVQANTTSYFKMRSFINMLFISMRQIWKYIENENRNRIFTFTSK